MGTLGDEVRQGRNVSQEGRLTEVFQIDNGCGILSPVSNLASACDNQLAVQSTDVTSIHHLHIPLDFRLGISYANGHHNRSIALIQQFSGWQSMECLQSSNGTLKLL